MKTRDPLSLAIKYFRSARGLETSALRYQAMADSQMARLTQDELAKYIEVTDKIDEQAEVSRERITVHVC